METSLGFTLSIMTLIVVLTRVSCDSTSHGVNSCFGDLCRPRFYCDRVEERCSPCCLALCRMKNIPRDCRHFCWELKEMRTSDELSNYMPSDTVQLAVVTATILVMLLVNIISNCVNTKLLLVIKQARDYGGKPGMKLTASRKPSNTVEDMSALALPTTKQFLSIRQPPFVPLAHVTNTGPSLPLRYDFDVCRQSNSEDCQIGCDNDSSPSCVPACHCDSQLTDTDSSEIPVISMDLTLSQPFQPSFPLDEETSLKMTD